MERVPTGYYCFLTFSHRFELAEEKEGFFLRIFNVFQKILLEKKCEEVGFIKEKAKEDPLGALAKCQLPPNYCLDLSSPLKDKAGFLEELKHACRLSPIDKEPLLKDAISKTEKDFPGVIALLSKAPKDFNVFYLLVIAHVLNEKSESAISLTGQALKELRIEGSIEAIRYYQHLLTYVPTYWQGYHKLASIMKTNPEKAHVLIKGSLEAIKAKEFVEARGFCDEAHKKYPDSFMDRWVDVLIAKEERKPDILTNREIQKILLSLLQAHPIPSDSASLIQLYEMLLHLGYSSHLCQEVVSWYFRQGDSKNGFRWLKELEQQGCGGSAKSDIVPIKGPKSAPQISKDLVTSVPKGATKELWSCLAAIYMAHGQVDDAEACYKECETFEMAMALAEAFYGLESFPKSAGYYYEALRLAGVDIGKIVRGVDGIKKIDPEMRQLSFQQQAQMRLWELLIKQREKIDDLNAQLERPRGYSSRLEISELPPICHILPKDWNICSELAPPPDMDPWLQGPCPFFGRKKKKPVIVFLFLKDLHWKDCLS
ncbi:MAG: hypothetical protein LVR00_08180 [Rhabdochlamydiaceae bacterium]|jgi:tetratricopeptide (TPR) repeat protein